MKAKIKKTSLISYLTMLFAVLSLFFINVSNALATVDTPRGSLRVGTNYDSSITRFSDANTFLTAAVDFALNFVAILAIAAIIYGGFLMLTSRGEEEIHKKGIKVVSYAVIGIVLILFSYAIVNTVISFGTGTEGVPGSGSTTTEEECVDGAFDWMFGNSCDEDGDNGGSNGDNNNQAGNIEEFSDNPNIVKANMNAGPVEGTTDLRVSFSTEGSYDKSNNIYRGVQYPHPTNYYWDFGDGTTIMGILEKNNEDNLIFRAGGQTEVDVIAPNGAVFDSTLDFANNPKYKTNINAALAYYGGIDPDDETREQAMGMAIVSTIITDNQYPVLLYGRRRKIVDNDIGSYSFLTGNTAVSLSTGTVGTEIIELLNPGTDGQVATILNPYGLKLGYVQEHTYVKAGNFRPKLFVTNDSDTPFSPTDDLKAYKSILIRTSRTNLDINSIPPTAAFLYEYDSDDPHRVMFKNMSLTTDGTFINDLLSSTESGIYPLDIDPYTDSDGDGNTENDNDTFSFEWDFDIDKDTDGNGSPTDDSDYYDSNIENFQIILNYAANSQFTFDDSRNRSNFTIQMREPGSMDYTNIISNIATAPPVTNAEALDINTSEDKILYFRVKTPDNKYSPELKVIIDSSNDGQQTSQTFNNYSYDEVYKVFPEELDKVRVKLTVKNLITQDKNTIVRQIELPSEPIVPPTPPTALFSYKVERGEKNITFYNLSLDVNEDPIVANAGSTTTINGYDFSWDFDTENEFDELIIYPEHNLNNYITESGGIDAGSPKDNPNKYTSDGITDNDENTIYNGLPANSGMTVSFPEDKRNYKVQLTVKNEDGLEDKRIINVYLPPEKEVLSPIAGFSWETGIDASSNAYLNFQLKPKYFNDENYVFINIDQEEGLEDFRFLFDFDINIDTDGDNNKGNDVDFEITDHANYLSPDGIIFPSFDITDKLVLALGSEEEYNTHLVKLTVKYKDKEDSVIKEVKKLSLEEIQNMLGEPVAAFIDEGENNTVDIKNKSYGINGEALYDGINNYNFSWDNNIDIDSNGDGNTENDIDSILFDPIDLVFENNGKYKVKLTVIYTHPTLEIRKSNSIIREIIKTAKGAGAPDPKPLASFRFQEIGNKQIQFTNLSLDNSGSKIGEEAPSITVLWDFDLAIDGDGNGIKDDDSNYSTKYEEGKFTKDKQGVLSPLRYYGQFDEDLGETGHNYGTYQIKLSIIEELEDGITVEDSVIRNIRLNNPPSILQPIVNFSYLYDPSSNLEDSLDVAFSNNSTDYFGNELEEDSYQVIWDFDLNTDSNNDGDSSNDNDSLNSSNAPCYFDNNICTYPQVGQYPIKLTLKNKELGIEYSATQVVKLSTLPPETPYYAPPPTAAFTYEQQNNPFDNQVIFSSEAIDNLGNKIDPLLITWDFDLMYDSDGDGNNVNDNDNIGTINDKFEVTSNPSDNLLVIYKDYGTYNVKQTVNLEDEIDTVTRKVILNAITIPLPPLPMFTYSKQGTVVKFSNKSIDGLGNNLRLANICADSQDPEINNCYKVEWYFDYNEESTNPNTYIFGPDLQHDYQEIGNYEARLIITDPSLNTESTTKNITIADDSSDKGIHASIKATPQMGTAPLKALFSSEGSWNENGSITAIYWDFDNDGQIDETQSGDTMTQTTVDHIFETPGHYRVGVAIEGSDGTRAIAFTWINVYGEASTAKIILSSQDQGEILNEIDESLEYMSYINNPINIKTYLEDERGLEDIECEWFINDPAMATPYSCSIADSSNNIIKYTNPISHTFTEPGLYELRFKIVNNNTKLTNIVNRKIRIYPAPPIAKLIAKNLITNIISPANQMYLGGQLDETDPVFEVEFDHSQSEKAPGSESDLVKFHYDFGDGYETTELSKDIKVMHSYTKPGTYNITLIVIDDDNLENKALKKVFIADARQPIPHINITPTFTQTGTSIKFDARGSYSSNGEIVDYVWVITNTDNLDLQAIRLYGQTTRYAFNNPGHYNVSLNIKDRIGEETKILLENTLYVQSRPPVARLTHEFPEDNIPNKVLLDASGSFDSDTGETNPNLLYSWDFADGTTLENQSSPYAEHIYQEKGRYIIKVTVSNMDLFDTAQATVHIDSLLRAEIISIEPRAGKAPLEVEFEGIGGVTQRDETVDSSKVVTYRWDFDDGTIISQPNATEVTHIFERGGKKDVTLSIYDDEDNSASVTRKVYVGDLDPAPIAIIEGNNFEGYRGVDIDFDGSKSLTPEEIPDYEDDYLDLNYSWDFGDDSSIITDTAEPEHQYEELGDYTVTLTVTYTDPNSNITSKASRDTISVEIVKARPQARFTTDILFGESPLLVHFDASNSNDPDDNIEYYTWKFGETTIPTTNDEIDYVFQNNSDAPITYRVHLKVSDEDDLFDSYSKDIIVLPEGWES